MQRWGRQRGFKKTLGRLRGFEAAKGEVVWFFVYQHFSPALVEFSVGKTVLFGVLVWFVAILAFLNSYNIWVFIRA